MNAPRVDFNDENSNSSPNTHLDTLLQRRLSRRQALAGGGAVVVGATGLMASPAVHSKNTELPGQSLLGFKAVAKTRADTVTLPEGYT